MSNMKLFSAAIAALAVLGCDPQDRSPAAMIAESHDGGGSHPRVVAMTQNLYVGADVDAIIAALRTPERTDDRAVFALAIENLKHTNFEVRAAAMAAEIAQVRPHVIALQEVSTIDIRLTDPARPGMVLEFHQDFLPILLRSLARLDLRYEVASSVTNLVAEPYDAVRLVNKDVLLFHAGRAFPVRDPVVKGYQNNLGLVAPGVVVTRGWTGRWIAIEGHEIFAVSTQLESGNVPGMADLRAAQAAELMAGLREIPRAVVMGDFAAEPSSRAYTEFTGEGFRDLWPLAAEPGYLGYTCCEEINLKNVDAGLNTRVDYIFVKGIREMSDEQTMWVDCSSDDAEDRVPGPRYPLWPSDHAGVVGSFLMEHN